VSLCTIIEPFSFKITFSFPPLESKLLGGKCLTYIDTEGHELDTNPWLLNVKNGTLDLRTGELHLPRKSDLITRMIDIEYHPGAQCPTWLEFLYKDLCITSRSLFSLFLAVFL
jgi:hypothetical protein